MADRHLACEDDDFVMAGGFFTPLINIDEPALRNLISNKRDLELRSLHRGYNQCHECRESGIEPFLKQQPVGSQISTPCKKAPPASIAGLIAITP